MTLFAKEPGVGQRRQRASARIGALAGAGKIIVSRDTAPNGDWQVSEPREVTLKGIAHP